MLDRISWLLLQEFDDYGYEKVRGWLNNSEGLIINGKKVYRLMQETRLLNSRIRRERRAKRIAKYLLQNPSQPCECMQTVTKYIYVHGEHRNALLITVLDMFSRGILGYRWEWSINKYQVIDLMRDFCTITACHRR
ncbi:helix-turn-helix protein [Pontibacter ummariensis]|uniref:HTH-like domain-containing protein n=2 Tax=Pontibacter ummariensis TaxID=1610492 RepID=A0A239BP71_9BACT|nr:helix-turn-helix protein [Pontibacter ummariensis]SNS09158.1 HTH-like domain-containing protein [Pontibacter ummariensis]